MAKKNRKRKRTTLALVESPAQLLNVIEWAFHHGAEQQTRLAVLPPRDATTRLQLEAMADLARDAGLAATWYEPRKSAAFKATTNGMSNNASANTPSPARFWPSCRRPQPKSNRAASNTPKLSANAASQAAASSAPSPAAKAKSASSAR